MGSSQSALAQLTQEILDEYTTLTYLSKAEILNLYKIFAGHDIDRRYPAQMIEEAFPELRFNPFKDRIFEVFSSKKDGLLSFEDVLDLCSAMSARCPADVKAVWAFRIFDFDGDGAVGEEDLSSVIDRLTGSQNVVEAEQKKQIVKVLLDEMDLETNGAIGQLEFQHAIGKMSEFPHSFCFRF